MSFATYRVDSVLRDLQAAEWNVDARQVLETEANSAGVTGDARHAFAGRFNPDQLSGWPTKTDRAWRRCCASAVAPALTWPSANRCNPFTASSSGCHWVNLASSSVSTYVLQLSDRAESIGFLTAGAAYRWLDANGRPGEQYKLGYTNEHPSCLQLIDAGRYRQPDVDPAA